MITRINANTTTTARKNNPNFKMRFDEKDIHHLATCNCGHGNKLVTCTSMGAYTRVENEDIIKNLLEKHNNILVRKVAQVMGIIPKDK